MKKSITHSFISSLLIISSVIAFAEALVMQLLQALPQWGISLTPLQETILDTALLSVLSAPLIWSLSLRPLARKINDQHICNESQNQYNQQLLKALDIHALVSITDVNGCITHVNRQFCEVSGYSESDLLGQDHRIINSGYHDKAFIRDLWLNISQGRPWQAEVCNCNKQGQFYWVDTSIVPLLGEDNKPSQYISIAQDISQVKENQNNLLVLKRALDASNDMIIVTDAQGRIQYVNPETCNFTGWKADAILGKTPTLFDSPAANPETLQKMQQHLRQGNTWSGRLLSRRHGPAPFNIAGQTTPPDQRDYWAEISITGIRNDVGKLLGYVQIQRDITEQVDKEQSLRMENADTKARLAISETLQQSLPLKQRITQILDILFNLKAFDLQRKGGVFLKDPEQDFLDMFVLHGQFSEEFIRREQRIPYGACLCGRAAISQEMIVSDDCFCDPRHDHVFDGMQPHGHYIVPIVSAGATLGILFLYTDPYPVQNKSRLTMLQQVGDLLALALLQEQAKKSLESACAIAEQAAKTKAEFLANMSHEIRTPMNGVLGMLDIMKDTPMSREQQDLITTASHSAESLLIIINDILDFSKLEAGKIEFEHIEFNLPMLVEEVCALMSARAHDKGLELNCFLPPSLPQRWRGDPNRIRQVLTNLIGNAVKFTDHGEVSINLLTQPNNTDKTTVRFEIKDTGIGLSPEGQARLFQPFSQADSSTARRFGGTGLGLSICKNLVHRMQGTIGVESAIGQGACFWFNLPLEIAEYVDTEQLQDLAGKRALIVDDNATNRKILHHYLEHWGMLVSESDNALTALQSLEAASENKQAFDILLTDLHMPEMDGCALAQAITTNSTIANTPRLLLSSGGLSCEADRMALGFAQILLKPVRQMQLFDAISSAMQESANKTQRLHIAKNQQTLPDYSSKRLLVVEDNPINQKVIMAMLNKFNCTADLAENGQQALDKLTQQTYDLVLMDCQMPILDGYSAVRILRGQELTNKCLRTPVVALTAHASQEERGKCLSAGMDDFLSKPITRSELATMLAHWLEEAKPTKITPKETKDTHNDHQPHAIWDEATALKHLDDDNELLHDMIDLFLQDMPSRQQALEEAFINNNLPALADAAHAIKGMAGHFCAEQLIKHASLLEHSARQGESSDFQKLTQNVADSATRLISALEQKQGSTL